SEQRDYAGPGPAPGRCTQSSPIDPTIARTIPGAVVNATAPYCRDECSARLVLRRSTVREALPILAAQADCGDSDLCRWLWRVTGQAWLAESSDVILVKPLRILMIVLIAMIVRYLLHRTINRLIRSTA